jgi:hypothetical protein
MTMDGGSWDVHVWFPVVILLGFLGRSRSLDPIPPPMYALVKQEQHTGDMASALGMSNKRGITPNTPNTIDLLPC